MDIELISIFKVESCRVRIFSDTYRDFYYFFQSYSFDEILNVFYCNRNLFQDLIAANYLILNNFNLVNPNNIFSRET